MNLAGATVRKEHVLLLAALVDGELAAKLNRAVFNNNTIVALSAADREHVLAVLGETPPGGLSELRTVLVKQGDHARRREAHVHRQRRELERMRSRNPGREAPSALDAIGGGGEHGL
jgi:hypothetical protein